MMRLRDFTSARVELGRTGHSLPTRELLDFQLAHARARDAVHLSLDVTSLASELKRGHVNLHSAAPDRATYLRRPDLGRQLNSESRDQVRSLAGEYDAAFVIGDGLSALAVHRHAVPLIDCIFDALDGDWKLPPIAIVEQARVAVADEIGSLAGAKLSVILIGERPGLSSPDSLGVYLTWAPKPGRTDAERNCISNIRPEGLSYAAAAHKLLFLMEESRRLKLSGVYLKESARLLK